MTSRKIPLICSGHSRPVPDLAYSPQTADGFYIVSACLDGKPMLRNGITGDWIGTFVGHKGAVWSAHINSLASQVITGSADYTARLWDALNGDEIRSYTHQRIVRAVQFSPDQSRTVTGGQDKALRVYDLNKAETEPVLKLEGHTDTVKAVVWKDNDTLLSIATGPDTTLRVWDVRNPSSSVHTITTKSPINNIDLSNDNKHITAASGKEIIIWDRNTYAQVHSHSHAFEINSVCLSSDSQYYATGGVDFSVRVFELKSHKETELHKGHHGAVHVVRFAPDNATFASGSEDGTIRIWQHGEPCAYGLWEEKKEIPSQPTGTERS